MRRHLAALAVATMVPLAVGTSNAAMPPTEVGAHCAAEESVADTTVLGLSRSRQPLTAPADSVVTGWEVQVASEQRPLEQRLQVFRPLGSATFLAVAESKAEMVRSGANGFKTRIPVETGDRFGLRGTAETFVCDREFATSGLYKGPTQIGFPYEFQAKTRLASPLRAILELDADGDGFGDETQDDCNRDPDTRNRCPAVDLEAEATGTARSIPVSVTVGTRARVDVVAEASWAFRGPGKPGGGPRGGTMVVLMGGGRKHVLADRIARFRIKLPDIVLERLGELTPRQSLKAEVTVSAISTSGREAERKLTVGLPGRAQARPRR